MKGNFAVLGLQWGDEGKGKIVNFCQTEPTQLADFKAGTTLAILLSLMEKKLFCTCFLPSICHENALSLIGKE